MTVYVPPEQHASDTAVSDDDVGTRTESRVERAPPDAMMVAPASTDWPVRASTAVTMSGYFPIERQSPHAIDDNATPSATPCSVDNRCFCFKLYTPPRDASS
jgi:hypothetical protein